jgi:hypothetical protein
MSKAVQRLTLFDAVASRSQTAYKVARYGALFNAAQSTDPINDPYAIRNLRLPQPPSGRWGSFFSTSRRLSVA